MKENTNTTIVENNNQVTTNVTPTIKLGKSLAEKAILIQLQIGRFSSSVKDARVSKEVAHDENTTTDLVKVTKSLIKGEASKKVQNAEQKIRAKFYELTAPWNKEGERITKIENYLKTKLELEELSREYYAAVDELVNNYTDLIEDDKIKLGGMFNINDYPSKENFKSRFYVDISVKQLEKTDFRANILSNEEVEEINNQIEKRLESALKAAQVDNINKIREKLNHLLERIVDVDGKFHNSSIINVLDAISSAQNLNINDDTGLNNILEELKVKFSKFSADTIRANGNERINVAEETTKALDIINETMKCFM